MVDGDPPRVEAEGINFPGVWRHQVQPKNTSVLRTTQSDVKPLLSRALQLRQLRLVMIACLLSLLQWRQPEFERADCPSVDDAGHAWLHALEGFLSSRPVRAYKSCDVNSGRHFDFQNMQGMNS